MPKGNTKRKQWEEFTNYIGSLMTKEKANVSAAVQKAIVNTAESTVKRLKKQNTYLPKRVAPNPSLNNSKETLLGYRKMGTRAAGTYARAFKQRAMSKVSKNSDDIRHMVYSGGHEYSLTHLLENGHRIVDKNGKGIKHGSSIKRTRPVTHFKEAEEWAAAHLLKVTKQEVKTAIGTKLE